MTFLGHMGGPWGTMGDFFRSLGGPWGTKGDFWRSLGGATGGQLHCELVLLAEHWTLLGAATDNSGWPEWAGSLLEVSCGAVLQADSAGRTLEAVECSC